MKFKQELIRMCIDSEFIEWVGDRTFQEAWRDCHRGDWMCWLLKKANMCDLRTLTLIKARQASLVKHLMKDQGSLDALQAAFDFAEGKIGEAELQIASNAAYDTAYAAHAAAAAHPIAALSAAPYASAHAATAAAAAADIDVSAGVSYAVGDSSLCQKVHEAYQRNINMSAFSASKEAKSETLRKCADMVRETIPFESVKHIF